MHYQILQNFINERVRKGDIYVPSMILFLVKNNGVATTEQVAKLIYIFDFKYELDHYVSIVENFCAVLLDDYNIIEKSNNKYKLRTWPLSEKEIEGITIMCSKTSKGFFKNLNTKTMEDKQEAS